MANANEEAALAGIGELIFSLLIGYLGALEFAFVARQLYHWSGQHPNADSLPESGEELTRYRQRLDKEITEAAEREALAGTNVMQDGVCYSNGFRVDPKGDLAIELERQQKIEEETRRQLAEAEEKLRNEKQQQAEDEEKRQRKIKEEKEKAERQREAAENERKLIEAEKQREENERIKQEREENKRKLIEAERQREERERLRQEAEENERKLIAAENQRQENERLLLQQQLEEEENTRRLLEAENERQRILAEEEIERQLFEAQQQDENEDEQAQRDAEIVERLLAAERGRKFSATESELEEEALLEEQSRRLLSSKSDLETKQKMIEENARRFLEAEEEMVMLQQRMLQAAQKQDDDEEYLGMQPVEEELCIKKTVPPRFEEPVDEEPAVVVQKVKTQYGQTSGGAIVEEPYQMKSKTLTFPSVSDEGSSIEPNSSQQSSFSTQPSEAERPEPEGEDYIPDVQYTEDYLRSLDGIKSRPLVREDGSGRRRAFKKRRSSGSSNSSRDSRTSREEELKMFTSLEEEELRHGDREDYNPIKYSSEPTLRVKQPHHRRHKRSPAKDMKPASSSAEAGGTLEMLGEENTSPWGEIVPEHYKDTEFWKREKALSIDEEELELDKHASGEEVIEPTEAKIVPKSSSFEEASKEQNLEAASVLTQQISKEKDDLDNTSSLSDNKSNLQTSTATEEQSRTSPGLRRSPRIDEMVQYEERWSASHTPEPPTIAVREPDTAPWRDQYGLLMEGISDFYDFTASVNPSRSRPNSRNPSPQPKNVAHEMDVDNEHTLEVYDDTPDGLPAGELNCEAVLQLLESTMNMDDNEPIHHIDESLPLQNVADDATNGHEKIMPMVFEAQGSEVEQNSAKDSSASRSRSRSPLPTSENLERSITKRRQKLIKHNDELMERLSNSSDSGRNSPMEVVETNSQDKSDVVLPQPVIEINNLAEDEPMNDDTENSTREQMRLFVENLRAERNSRSRSRSRSRSPLPTADNIAKSLETRRLKRTQHNDELFEKLHIEVEQAPQAMSPAVIPVIEIFEAISPAVIPVIEIIEAPSEDKAVEPVEEEAEPVDTPESMAKLFEQLRLNRARSTHSHSRSRSPLPSAANLEQSLQKRRDKLIAQNDMLFEQLQERARTPEPEVRLTVEYVYEIVEESAGSRDMRSLSPSRSRSLSRSRSPSRSQSKSPSSEKEFHLMLNLEGSDQRTLLKHNEEWETVLAGKIKQRELDIEALQKFRNANEEVELRVLSPTASECEQLLPAYDRTMSEVARDLQGELKANDFKRSTYVGESLDLSRTDEDNRQSRSVSPMPEVGLAREQAGAQREIQAAILDSLTENRHGAKPKTSEYERTYVGESLDLSKLDDLRHRTAEFQRSRSQSRSPIRDQDEGIATLNNIELEVARRDMQDQLLDKLAASSVNFENFSRHLNADFLDSERRASDSALDSYGCGDLEPEEYHHFRRYSLAQEQPVEEYPSDDYVYISQIEVRTLTGTRTWLKEDFYTLEPENYTELDILSRRDDDENEIKDEESWAQAVLAAEAEAAEFDATNAIYDFDIIGADGEGGIAGGADGDEISSNDSEDERQTVVEIDDEEYEFELDEGISDYNERTQPTDESHHDTSECEEAERNTDRYANRRAQDWDEVEDVEDFLGDGAVGGATPYSDPDSFIEQIYNDAIKNRKQSGILRDYETMVQEQLPDADQSESDKEKSSSDSERRYVLWAKTRELNKSPRHNEVDIALGLTLERDNSEIRYLGDAHIAARQSTRLRTRYGYNPQLQVNALEDDIEVDMNYIPKREYNWRKNFKLDDNDECNQTEENHNSEMANTNEGNEETEMLLEENGIADTEDGIDGGELIDRRYSFGGESITLFSRSPIREVLPDVVEETQTELDHTLDGEGEVIIEEPQTIEKPKKKKSKKKSRKSYEEDNDNDSDNQMYRQTKEDSLDSTKRKSRSRRSSKSSITNADDNNGTGPFSPRASLALVGETLENIAESAPTEEPSSVKKKTKKRKKVTKEASIEQIEPSSSLLDEALNAALAEIAPISVSTNLTPESTQQNLLSTISTGQSRCLTPASSIEEPLELNPIDTNANNMLTNSTDSMVPARSVVDTFDILKDANFYPLF
ncbi:uncharacterized protein Dwil_GK18920, isoform C [Drosophila willistoni]|uniref:Uncharacterized protein, isoform C n=1 Tax=Drosophila willistoni TaxID=7260 RepID=B4MX93_DROWI|nr:uncharacterized protein Dwil_GK18920, isoform C [Drosophila willistoni]